MLFKEYMLRIKMSTKLAMMDVPMPDVLAAEVKKLLAEKHDPDLLIEVEAMVEPESEFVPEMLMADGRTKRCQWTDQMFVSRRVVQCVLPDDMRARTYGDDNLTDGVWHEYLDDEGLPMLTRRPRGQGWPWRPA